MPHAAGANVASAQALAASAAGLTVTRWSAIKHAANFSLASEPSSAPTLTIQASRADMSRVAASPCEYPEVAVAPVPAA